jgi:hypothetical protein
MDVCGHLMKGSQDEAVELVDAYLARDAPVMRQSDPRITEPSRT